MSIRATDYAVHDGQLSTWKAALRRVAKRVLRPAIPLIRWFRRAHTHVVVRAPDGSSAFGMIGSSRWCARFARIYLGDRDNVRIHHRVHRSSWVRHARVMVERHGLVVIADTAEPPEIADALLRIPSFVALSVDLLDSEAQYKAVLSSSARADLQKVRARKLTVELCRDPAWAEEFHRLHHVPSIVGRHGEEAFVMSADDMAALVRERNGEFLRVLSNGRFVGALLNDVREDEYALNRIGWLHGDPAWPKEGVISALYWHALQRARALGKRRVQLGGTPPVLENGVFQYKTKWNVALNRTSTVWGHYSLLLAPGHADTRRMFKHHSLIALNARDEFVVLSGKRPGEVRMSRATTQTIVRWYRLCDAPDADNAHANTDLPLPLRVWFRAEPMPEQP